MTTKILDKDEIIERFAIMTENGATDEEALLYLLQVFPEDEAEIRAIIAELQPVKTTIRKRWPINYIDRKIPLVPSISDDRGTRPICALYDESRQPIEENFIRSVEQFEDLVAGRGKLLSKKRKPWTSTIPVTIFQFYPKLGNMVVLDLDSAQKITGEQHGSGVDGITAFKNFIARKSDEMTATQRAMFDDFPNNFPCYVKTPSNGLHLYFRYSAEIKLKKAIEGTNIECKHRSLVTAAGSIRGNRRYRIFGSLQNMPFFPNTIFEEFCISDEKEEHIKTPDEVFESAIRTARLKGYAGNNELFFYVAGRFAWYYRKSGFPAELDEKHCLWYIQASAAYYDWGDRDKDQQLAIIISNAYRS